MANWANHGWHDDCHRSLANRYCAESGGLCYVFWGVSLIDEKLDANDQNVVNKKRKEEPERVGLNSCRVVSSSRCELKVLIIGVPCVISGLRRRFAGRFGEYVRNGRNCSERVCCGRGTLLDTASAVCNSDTEKSAKEPVTASDSNSPSC